MKRAITRRLAALGLAMALVAPAAWAGPARLELGSWWMAAWGWLADLWTKEGASGDPDGLPLVPTVGGDLPTDGSDSDSASCGIADCTDDGPALDPFGKPLTVPP